MSHGTGLGVFAAVCLSVVAGCSAPRAEVPERAYTVEELAAEVGCTPEFQGTASGFRQAGCTSGEVQYLLADFTTGDGQRAWLDQALDYGGPYLVGDRWVLAGSSPAAVEELRAKVGGTLEGNPAGSATHH